MTRYCAVTPGSRDSSRPAGSFRCPGTGRSSARPCRDPGGAAADHQQADSGAHAQIRGRPIHSTLPRAAISAETSPSERNPCPAIGGNALPLSAAGLECGLTVSLSVTRPTPLHQSPGQHRGGRIGQPALRPPAMRSLDALVTVCRQPRDLSPARICRRLVCLCVARKQPGDFWPVTFWPCAVYLGPDWVAVDGALWLLWHVQGVGRTVTTAVFRPSGAGLR
jgi:hypothetical protein